MPNGPDSVALQKLLVDALLADYTLKFEVYYELAKAYAHLNDVAHQKTAYLQGIQLWQSAQLSAER